MKGADRAILLVLPLLALGIGFYMLVISPKQAEISDLDERVTELRSTVDIAEAQVLAAEAARGEYGDNYADVVSLGAAVPEGSDQSTFIYDLSRLADTNSVQMLSFVLDDPGSEAAPAAPTTTTPEPIAPTDGGSVAVAAVPTEATAAPLPIGASVGPAALPIMPYDVRYNGNFFHMADLFAELDSKVELDVSNDASFKPDVQGRLVTVDGFAMVPDLKQGYPNVLTTIALTTYIVPEDQGLQAGGTPAGPAPVGSPEAPTITSTGGTFPGGATATVAP